MRTKAQYWIIFKPPQNTWWYLVFTLKKRALSPGGQQEIKNFYIIHNWHEKVDHNLRSEIFLQHINLAFKLRRSKFTNAGLYQPCQILKVTNLGQHAVRMWPNRRNHAKNAWYNKYHPDYQNHLRWRGKELRDLDYIIF